MRIHFICLSVLLIFGSCNNSEAQKTGSNSTNNTTSGNSSNKSASSKSSSGTFWQKIVMHEVKDKSGVVAALVPLPSSWKLNVNGASMVGPNGVKVTDFPLQIFMVNYNPNLQYAYSQTKQREYPGIDQLIQQDFVPSAAKRGLTYVKHYELPEISKIDKWYSDQLFKAMPSQSDVRAYGVEWKDKTGKMAFLLLRVNTSTSPEMQNWSYYSSLLEVDANAYELSKKQFIFSQANMRYNLEPIMAYNKAEAERCGKSWAAFNAKMKANQAAFEASQIAHVNKVNGINDAIMSNWKSSNAASDKNQERFIDGIYERQNVQNSETGQTYKVQQGYNQYWMNNEGEYIGTKSNTYNPNLDDNMNEKKWQELKQIK